MIAHLARQGTGLRRKRAAPPPRVLVEGVGWSAARQRTWRLNNGVATAEISLADARAEATTLGLPVPPRPAALDDFPAPAGGPSEGTPAGKVTRQSTLNPRVALAKAGTRDKGPTVRR